MARTPRALAVPSSRGWRLSTASRTFRVLHRLSVILSLRRIRDPSARGHEVRILRLRSQARFAQDDTSLPYRVRKLSKSTTEARPGLSGNARAGARSSTAGGWAGGGGQRLGLIGCFGGGDPRA